MATHNLKRGDIWIVDFDPASGHEQKGVRPAVVFSSDMMDTALIGLAFVIPGTTRERPGVPNHFRVTPDAHNGLNQVTFFMCEQLRSVDVNRFRNKIGVLSQAHLCELEEIAILLLDLGED